MSDARARLDGIKKKKDDKKAKADKTIAKKNRKARLTKEGSYRTAPQQVRQHY